MDRNAHQRANHMAANQISGLGERAVYNSINQHGGCAERTDEKQIVCLRQIFLIQKTNQTNTQKRTDEGPDMILKIDKCFFINHIPCQAYVSFNPFPQNSFI